MRHSPALATMRRDSRSRILSAVLSTTQPPLQNDGGKSRSAAANLMHDLKIERFFKASMINGLWETGDGPIKTFPLRGVNESYVRRVLRLTLLAPDIVEAILEGRQSAEITLAVLMRPFAVTWMEQRKTLIGCLPRSPACLDAMP